MDSISALTLLVWSYDL